MKRIPQLDGVRALAILAVFFHHAFRLKLMWMGVDLFFVLSGFLITGVLMGAKHHSLKGFFTHFYSRRARRILPPYLLWLVVASFLFGAAWMRHWYFYLLLTNLLLPLHIPRPVAFDPLWSLAVEEQFYLAWPFAVYYLSERWLRRLALLLVLVAPLLRAAFHFQQHWPIYTLTPFRMDLLAAGALLWMECRRNRARIERRGAAIGALLAVAGLAGLGLLARFRISTFDNTRAGNALIYECSLLICAGFILYALSGKYVGWLRVRPLTYLGQISYSMYLVHLGFLSLIPARLPTPVAAALGLLATIAYAAASWHWMEGPLLARGKDVPQKRAISA
jgi:peptidoglycan/LPS O-acetylase OafA/YrhL